MGSLLSSCDVAQAAAGVRVLHHLRMSCCSTSEINCHWFITECLHALKDVQTCP